ncbi:MAG: type 4a pilus biogenesis protein PilO [Pirellulales bacterium]
MSNQRSQTTMLAVDAGMHAACLCVAALVAFAGWSAAALLGWRIAATQQEADDARSFLAGSQAVLQQNESLNQQCQALDQESSSLHAKIPSTSQEEDFLAQITALAADCQLELGEFRPGPPAERDGFSEFEVQINGRGSYDGVCRFLAGLQGLPRLCKLAQLGLSSADESGENCVIETRLLVPYNLSQVAAAPTGEQRP